MIKQSDTREKILKYLIKYPMSLPALSKKMGVHPHTVRAFIYKEKEVSFKSLCIFENVLDEEKQLLEDSQ